MPFSNTVNNVAEFAYPEMGESATFAIHELELEGVPPHHPSATAMVHHLTHDVLGMDLALAFQPERPEAVLEPGTPEYLALAVNEYLLKNGDAAEAIAEDFRLPLMNRLWGDDVDMHMVGGETMATKLLNAGGRHFVAVGHGMATHRSSLGYDPTDHPTGDFLLAYANIKEGNERQTYLNEFMVHRPAENPERLRRPVAALAYLATRKMTERAHIYVSPNLLANRGDQVPDYFNFAPSSHRIEDEEVYTSQRLHRVRAAICKIIDCDSEKMAIGLKPTS